MSVHTHEPNSAKRLIERVRGFLPYRISHLKYEWHIQKLKLIDVLKSKQNSFDSSQTNGLPIPPLHMLFWVGFNTDVTAHLQGGKEIATKIREMLRKNNISIENFKAILDFGCGCGRIIRWWTDLQETKMHGTDYNRELIQWCRQNLRFAEFSTNKLVPPTSYETEEFDFIYAISVFTHLSESLQQFWMEELWRILRPGGHILITTHGMNYVDRLSKQDQDLFQSGKLLVIDDRSSGSNLCAAFHPETYVREKLARDFTVIDFIPNHYLGQDFYLLRRLNTIDKHS